MKTPSDDIRARIERILGAGARQWSPIHGGYTPAARWRVVTADGTAFAKIATSPLTARMLRREFAAYDTLEGSFMPRLIGYDDDPERPILVIEDLSSASWPPPWHRDHLTKVHAAFDQLHAVRADLPSFATVHGGLGPGWADVEADPAAFLGLGVADAAWLSRALPPLRRAEAECDFTGDTVSHFDLRSDNICIDGDRAVLVDWAEACLSNSRVDIGFWCPSLAYEGGPQPEELLPDAPEIAAWVSGYFASRAGLPDIPSAPRVRKVQREQLSTALPWAIRALGLPSPG